MRSIRTAGRRGFTLIELLTVISIIAILAALIMVAVISAQESGRIAHCKNNLTQLSKLIYMYTNTYGGYLPAFWHERWVGELGLVGRKWGNSPDDVYDGSEGGDFPMPTVWCNYSPSHKWLPGGTDRMPIRTGAPVLVCKSDLSAYRCDQGCFLSYMGLAKYGWYHRGNVSASAPRYEYHQLQEFDNATRRLMLAETEPGTWQMGGCGCRWHCYRHPVSILERHYGGGNILFFDGHVTLVKDEKRMIRYWEPDYDQTNPGY